MEGVVVEKCRNGVKIVWWNKWLKKICRNGGMVVLRNGRKMVNIYDKWKL